VIFVLAPRALRVEKKKPNKSTRAAPGTRPNDPTPSPRPLRPAPRRPGRTPLGQQFQTHTAKVFQFDLAYKHQRSTSRAVDGSFYALIKAMPLVATKGGFITPKSEVWGNVTALCEVKSGHCKSMR
jgi:hypothetical protein